MGRHGDAGTGGGLEVGRDADAGREAAAGGSGGRDADAGAAVDASKWDATPTPGRVADSSKWDATPTPGRVADASKWDATPTPGRSRTRQSGMVRRPRPPPPARPLPASPPRPPRPRPPPARRRPRLRAPPAAAFSPPPLRLAATPTPGRIADASKWDANPTPGRAPDGSKWDATPTPGRVTGTATPSRWDSAPTPGGRGRGEQVGRDADAGARARRSVAVDATPMPGRRRRRLHLGRDADAGARRRRQRHAVAQEPLGRDADASATNAWDSTPMVAGSVGGALKPAVPKSRWDDTPANVGGATPMGAGGFGATPGAPLGPIDAATPIGAGGGMGLGPLSSGPGGAAVPMTPEAIQQARWAAEIDERNRPLTDDDLDAMFPPTGYKILKPPDSYVPISPPARKLLETPTPAGGGSTPLYTMPDGSRHVAAAGHAAHARQPPLVKPEDYQYFAPLLKEDEELLDLTPDEARERKIMQLLLKVKNGTPPMRKQALRQISEKAREFGAGPLFNQILPLLMSPTLEDQERHLLVKVIDRVLYKLDDLVRPYVHKILVVIEPLLIDENYYARVEGARSSRTSRRRRGSRR